MPASREWRREGGEGEIGTISSTHTPATLHLLLSTGAVVLAGYLRLLWSGPGGPRVQWSKTRVGLQRTCKSDPVSHRFSKSLHCYGFSLSPSRQCHIYITLVTLTPTYRGESKRLLHQLVSPSIFGLLLPPSGPPALLVPQRHSLASLASPTITLITHSSLSPSQLPTISNYHESAVARKH